ncbi:MAG: hypothetical protein LUH05_01760 [Candidatus Gastranaerophilales bacterium]|nr:hypothetical protein [Candidatus Gastranaerophilales bacterium]
MSNGAGLLKCGHWEEGGYYINPNNVTAIQPNNKRSCNVTLKDVIEDYDGRQESLRVLDFDCISDKFADAMIKAQNTGEIVDIYA